ncbi:MAG: hypothetical protein PHD01_08860 [Geobacteraceae bacterium]|nr:hypothetical protein [Geobacteraceae bacterium]
MRNEIVKSIIEKGDLSVPSGKGIRGADGRDYSWFGIGSALISLPLYVSGKIMGFNEPDKLIYVVNPLISAATLVLIFRFCLSLGYSIRSSFFTSLLYGFATLAWRFSKDPGDHALETFFILFSVYCTYLYSVKRLARWILFSGILLGIACVVRPTSLLVLPSLFLMLFIVYWNGNNFNETARKIARDCFLFSLTFLPFALINLWYNYYRFGSIFESGYTLMAARSGVSYFSNTSILEGLKGFLISPGKGFFYYSPVAILFFFTIRSFFKRNTAVAACFVCLIITYIAFFSKYIYWHGDRTWGPRYIFLITPYLIIPITDIYTNQTVFKKHAWRSILSLLIVSSMLIQVVSVSVNTENYFIYLFDKGVKFSFNKADGVQTINVPASEIYYNWRLSPVFVQSTVFLKIIKDIRDYHYVKSPENTSSTNTVNASAYMHVFDFWFVYTYFLYKSIAGFIFASILLLMSIFTAFRLKKLLVDEGP